MGLLVGGGGGGGGYTDSRRAEKCERSEQNKRYHNTCGNIPRVFPLYVQVEIRGRMTLAKECTNGRAEDESLPNPISSSQVQQLDILLAEDADTCFLCLEGRKYQPLTMSTDPSATLVPTVAESALEANERYMRVKVGITIISSLF